MIHGQNISFLFSFGQAGLYAPIQGGVLDFVRLLNIGIAKGSLRNLLPIRSPILLDDNKFGPGNRPYWEMKEG